MATDLQPPVLDAGAYVLRPWTLADLAAVEEASRDDLIPLITTVPSPYSHEQGVAFIRRQWSRAATGEGYSFAIAEHCGQAVGQVGLWLRNGDEGRASLGYWVAASARGRGAAAQALTAVARWAFGLSGINRLELYVEPWNVASIRTAERARFQREGLLRSWQLVGGQPKDMFVYSRVRADLGQ